MLDAAALEKQVIHTVTIVWDNFEAAARTQAHLQGVSDLELAVILHRKGGETATTRSTRPRHPFLLSSGG